MRNKSPPRRTQAAASKPDKPTKLSKPINANKPNKPTKPIEPKKKLSLDQKRAIAQAWFADPAQGRIRDLPAARTFVRRAATDLGLMELRKLRNATNSGEDGAEGECVDVDGIDEIAYGRIVGYRPRKAATGAGVNKKANQVRKAAAAAAAAADSTTSTNTILDDATLKSILLAFHSSPLAVPLGRFLRDNDILQHKAQILSVVKAVQLRKMRRMGVERDVVVERIEGAMKAAGVKEEEMKNSEEEECSEECSVKCKEEEEKCKKEASVETCADDLEAMQIDDQDDAVSEDEGNVRKIEKQQRRAERKAKMQQRKAKRMEQRKSERRSARMAERKKTIEAKQHRRAHEIVTKSSNFTQNPTILKSLVIEWFDHPTRPSIVDFLKSKDDAGLLLDIADAGADATALDTVVDTYKRPMRLVCKAGQLQKFRRSRENPGVRVQAMHLIDTLFAGAGACAGGANIGAETVTIEASKTGGKARAAARAMKEKDFGMANLVDATTTAEAVNKPVDVDQDASANAASKEMMKKLKAERRAARRAEMEQRKSERKREKTMEGNQQQQQQQKRRAQSILAAKSGSFTQNPEVLKSLVIEWFDHPAKPSIVDFLKSKDADGGLLPAGADATALDTVVDTYKRPMRLVCKAGQLQKFRRARDSAGVRVQAMHVVDALLAGAAGAGITNTGIGAVKIEASKSGGKARAAARAIKKKDFGVAGTVVDASTTTAEAVNGTVDIDQDASKEMMKKLIMEWYDDKDMRPVRKFLKEEGHMPTVRQFLKQYNGYDVEKDKEGPAPPAAVIVGMIKSKSLMKLRKAREDPDVAALAKVRIEQLFDATKGGATKKNAKKPGKVGKVRLQKKAMSDLQQEHLKTYLVEWFYGEDMVSIPDFLQAKGHPELRPVMAKLVTELGLRQLRKERRAIRMTASRRIDGAFGKKKQGQKQPDPGDPRKKIANKAMMKKKKVVPADVTPSAPPADLVEEDDYVSVAAAVAQEDTPPPTYDAVAEVNKDLDFVVIQ